MSEVSHTTIESLIASSDVKGNKIDVLFRCPVTGVEASSTAPLKKLGDMKSKMTRSVKKNVWSGLRRSATRAVSDTLGKGMAGKIAKDLTSTGLKEAEKNSAFSELEIQAAIVAAFESVRARFRWDDASEMWVGVDATEATPAS